jgi:hypothetical protein
MCSVPRHSVATRNSVCLSAPPSMHAKQPRSRSIVCSTWPALANAHAPPVRNVAVPDGPVGVQADTVGHATIQVGPDPPVRQAAVGGDVERRELVGVGLGDDQPLVVGRHGHPIGEADALGHLASRPVGGEEGDRSGGELATWNSKPWLLT